MRNDRYNFGLTEEEIRDFMKRCNLKSRDEFINLYDFILLLYEYKMLRIGEDKSSLLFF